jgi:hypothetical protein
MSRHAYVPSRWHVGVLTPRFRSRIVNCRTCRAYLNSFIRSLQPRPLRLPAG